MRMIYNILVRLFARPRLQFIYEKQFRVLIGMLGYMNQSPDFKLTGEKRVLTKINNQNKLNLILDIGANSGQWTSMALGITACQIICFEPSPTPFLKLTDLALQNRDRVLAFNLALGDERKADQYEHS